MRRGPLTGRCACPGPLSHPHRAAGRNGSSATQQSVHASLSTKPATHTGCACLFPPFPATLHPSLPPLLGSVAVVVPLAFPYLQPCPCTCECLCRRLLPNPSAAPSWPATQALCTSHSCCPASYIRAKQHTHLTLGRSSQKCVAYDEEKTRAGTAKPSAQKADVAQGTQQRPGA